MDYCVTRSINCWRSRIMWYFSKTVRELQNVVETLNETAQKMGLEINEEKTKYLVWKNMDFSGGSKSAVSGRNGRRYSVEEVDSFKYLGVTFIMTPECNTKVPARVQAGSSCAGATNRTLRKKTHI